VNAVRYTARARTGPGNRAGGRFRVPIRWRLALWYGSLCALSIALVSLLGFGVYARGQYQLLEEVLKLSTLYVVASWQEEGTSAVLEADITDLVVHFRLYDNAGNLKRSSRFIPVLPELDILAEFGHPDPGSTQQLVRWLPFTQTATVVPENTTFALLSAEDRRWRSFLTPLLLRGETVGFLEAITPLQQLDASVRKLGYSLLGLGLLSIFVVLGLSFVLARSALLPIARLTKAAASIAHSRDLSQRVEAVKGNDEMAQLANTFNEMLESLEESSQQQQRFVADASHELRAPLAAILGNLELLRRYPHMSSEQRDESLAGAERETTRLSRLVADLLTLAKGDAGVVLRLEQLALDDLVQEAVRDTTRYALKHHLEMQLAQQTWVRGDRDFLKQLLLILLDNAVKYTPEQGKITVSLRVQQGSALVEVKDAGIGMTSEDVAHAFERFYRADPARQRDPRGTGLGLAIARWIVTQHGGEIRLESVRGQGTVASVLLPLLVINFPTFRKSSEV
jgi:two-component system, OmpR family, sensor kinase